MKHIVSFSGGRTSAYLVYLMEQKRISEGWDVDYVFIDTGAEHPKTYEFVRNVVKHLNINLTCIRAVISQIDGVGPTYETIGIGDIGWDLKVWRDMVSKYGAPYNPGGPFCTDRMKTVPYQKYVKDTYGKGNTTTWLGIRIDESRRLKKKDGYRYLADISPMKKYAIINYWKNMPFDLELDEWLGNCVFCIKKGTNKVALAMRQEPELAKQFEEMITQYANKEKRNNGDEMYRGKLDLKGVAQMYSHKTEDELAQSFRYKRHCGVANGESCEVFGCQDDL